MKFQLTFQKDLFGADAGVFGWPSDGLDEPGAQAADLRTAVAKTLRVKLALGAPLVQQALEGLKDATAISRDAAAAHHGAATEPDVDAQR